MTNRQKESSFIIPLIIIEAILYLLFVLSDLSLLRFEGVSSNLLKYISIILLFICSAIFVIQFREFETIILCSALFFTVIADFFLLFTTNLIPGILSFLVVQQLYLILILKSGNTGYTGKLLIKNLFIRLPLAALFMIILTLVLGIEAMTDNWILYTICILYGICFLLNVITAFLRHTNALLKYGLLLFLLCDVCVLLTNMPSYFVLSTSITHFCRTIAPPLMWIFYLPGKLMISLSVYQRVPK